MMFVSLILTVIHVTMVNPYIAACGQSWISNPAGQFATVDACEWFVFFARVPFDAVIVGRGLD
jgi:hypothetical protein